MGLEIVWQSGEATVWRAEISPQRHSDMHVPNAAGSPYEEAHLESLLSADELARANRYGNPELRWRFVFRRRMARLLLMEITGRKQIEFVYSEFKKPSIEGGPHFNMSSSGDELLIAISTRGPIGVDIERIDPDFRFEPLLADHFTEEERQSLDGAEEFYSMWTRKEACAKALGIGLAEPLSQYPALGSRVSAGSQVFLVDEIPSPEGYAAAVAIIGS